ncbi:hypothetical protein RsTz2092_07470 [Deferribacterales bacterium RsTz2092]|nr:hypothetical protein AGMMS49941_09540 [Deferribacterales bacterium]
MTGWTGVPLAFQRYVELDRDVIYKDSPDYKIIGSAIQARADNATLVVKAGEKASKDYRRLTLVLSNMSEHTNFLTTLNYSDSSGKVLTTDFCRLRNGFNLSGRFNNGVAWTNFNLKLSTRASFTIDKVYLSEYSVLPNVFIPIFLAITALIVLTSYLFFYKALYDSLNIRPAILLVVIVAVQLGAICYYSAHKTALFDDERLAYVLANDSTYPDKYSEGPTTIKSDPESYYTWGTGKDYLQKITAQRGEWRTQYKRILDIPKRYDYSVPSFYFLQLHFVSSLFPDTFSHWLGVSVNIVWFILTAILLYRTSLLLLPDKLALLPQLLWGFSGMATHIYLYSRVYSVTIFFYTAIFGLALYMLKNKEITWRYYVALALTYFFGFWTHYNFVIWFALVAGSLLVYLLVAKRFAEIKQCIITIATSSVLYFIVNPSALKITSTSKWLSYMRENQTTTYILHRLNAFVDKYLFSGETSYLLFLAFIFMVACARKLGLKKFITDNRESFTLIGCLGLLFSLHLVLLAKYGAGWAVRYVSGMAPALILSVIFALFTFGKKLITRSVFAGILVVISLTSIVCKYIHPAMYQDTPTEMNVTGKYHNVPCILLGSYYPSNDHTRMQVLSKFDRVMIAKVVPNDYDKSFEAISKAIGMVNADKIVVYSDTYSGTKESSPVEDVALKTGYKKTKYLGNMLWLLMRE